MSNPERESSGRVSLSFWLFAGVIFAAQIGLIFVLSDRTPITAREAQRGSRIRLASRAGLQTDASARPAASDPMLFSLISPRGFSGPAWLGVPRRAHALRDWSEPARWLVPDQSALGAGLRRVVENQNPSALATSDKPPPALAAVHAPPPPLATQSVVRVEGPLAARPFAAPLTLPPQVGAELLTNSVVQVAAAPSGEVIFATLLSVRGPKSAGQQQADNRALDLARQARFEPLPTTGQTDALRGSELSWGTLIFQWHTTPPGPATNAPPQTATKP